MIVLAGCVEGSLLLCLLDKGYLRACDGFEGLGLVCSTAQCSAGSRSAVLRCPVPRSPVQCSVAQYSALQYSAVQ